MMLGGIVAVAASFVKGTLGTTAWGEGAFPIVSLIPIYSGTVALLVVISRFGNRRFAPRVMGFTWPQLYLVLGTWASVMAACWIIAESDFGDVALGGMLAGSLLVVVGALLSQRGRRRLGLA
jgi:hypothetical protein